MNPTATRTNPVRPRRAGRILGLLVGIGLAAALAAAVAPALRDPANVARLTIDNQTVYQLNVEVSATGDGGWADLGTVGRQRAKAIAQIADQGERWFFRFSYGGVDAGRVVRTRAELASGRWTLSVPAEVGDRLRSAGMPPSAF